DLDKSIIVAHRYHRSLPEYIAMLRKGDTTETRIIDGFKYNRNGWGNRAKRSIRFDSAIFNNYESDYKSFLRSNQIVNEVMQAQAFIMKQSEQVITHLNRVAKLNRILTRSLRGTGIKHQRSQILELLRLRV